MKAFKLENEPKIEPGFIIPENYFEHFSKNVMQHLPENEPKVISIFQKRKNILIAVAAVLIIALMIPKLFMSSITNEIDAATLENYLSYQTTINQYDLINALESEDIGKIETTLALEDKTIEDILATNADLEHLIHE